jgi:uncharacterized protein with PIN domain
MANKSGPQADIKHCPICKADLKNVPRGEMKSRVVGRDGSVPKYTHTYDCKGCSTRFEINQHR